MMGDDFPPFFVCYYLVTIIRYSTDMHSEAEAEAEEWLRQKGRGKSLLEGQLLGSKVGYPCHHPIQPTIICETWRLLVEGRVSLAGQGFAGRGL